MLFAFNGETLATFISVTKSCVCKDKFNDELRTTQVKANKNGISMYT